MLNGDIRTFASSTVHRAIRLTGHDVSRVGIESDYLAFAVNGAARPPIKAIESIAYWEHLKRHLLAAQIDLVLDVGANEGQFASGLRRIGYRGRIASFEPIPEVAERLADRAKHDALWSIYPMALGEDAGEAVLHVGSETTFASLRAPSQYGKDRYRTAISGAKEVRVGVRRLEEVLDVEFASVAQERIFLKLDTQGWDLAVFRGLGARSQFVKLLQAELTFQPLYEQAPEFVEAMSFFRQHGFRPTGFFPVCEEVDKGFLIEVDCLMVAAD